MTKEIKNSMKWKDEGFDNPLLQNSELFNAALDEFAVKSFNEASLNDILKVIKMNKGSFYYRFYDKMDLYLSVMHKLGLNKLDFFQKNNVGADFKGDVFENLKIMARLGILFARQENRYYSLWRKYLADDSFVHKVVRSNFDDFSSDSITAMTRLSKERGEFRSTFSEEFLTSLLRLLILNLDTLILPNMSDEEIILKVNEFTDFLKNGLGS